MRLLPHAKCPNCGGPITFWDILSILTPLQSTNCASCGEMVFIRYRWEMLWASLALSLLVLVFVMLAMLYELGSAFAIYASAVVFLLVVEYGVTFFVVKNRGLVVRRDV